MPEKYWKVRPTEHFDWIPNPHKGCATFQHFNGDPLFTEGRWSEEGPLEFPQRIHEGVTPGYLPSTVAYCRWFWEIFQPEKNRFDWSVIDKALETARNRGQTLHVRLMPYGSPLQPQLPHWYVDGMPTIDNQTKAAGVQKMPVHDGDEYYDLWGSAIDAFAERYDSHPDLSFFDISYIGPWGEGAGECSEPGIERMTGRYAAAFNKTPLCAMLSTRQTPAGLKHRTGWRCDCFGDQRVNFNDVIPREIGWNHTYEYPHTIHAVGAAGMWKHGPAVLETCGTAYSWIRNPGEDYDIGLTIQQGLKMHATEFMPKSCEIPEVWRDQLLDFCKFLGYRLALREIRYDTSATRPDGFEYRIWIENVGVAPLYHDYAFALKVSQDGKEYIHVLETDPREWLPGDICLEGRMPIPSDFEEGYAGVFAGIIDRESQRAKVRFAVEETEEDGWVRLEKLWVK